MSIEVEGPAPVRPASLRASRSLAAFLSFLIPGTGQFLTGRSAGRGVFLVPVIVAAVAAHRDRAR